MSQYRESYMFPHHISPNYTEDYIAQRCKRNIFSILFAIKSCVNCRKPGYDMNIATPSVLRFLSVIRHKYPHYNHAFTEKAQHLWR